MGSKIITISKDDKVHLGIGVFLAIIGLISLFLTWNFFVSLLLILILNIYIVAMCIECARRSTRDSQSSPTGNGEAQDNDPIWFELPNRGWAILLVMLLTLTNVSGFANLYIQSEGIETSKFYNTEKGLSIETIPLTSKLDALYFSAVTVTTLGYGDFLPNEKGRIYVLSQLASGLLLLFYVIPIVASRISSWE